MTLAWHEIGSSSPHATADLVVEVLDDRRMRAVLSYLDGNGCRIRQCMDMTSSPQPFGGLRWWFLCPLVGDNGLCGRLAVKLYLPPGPDAVWFGCRHCYGLSYRSRQRRRQGRSTLGPSHLEGAPFE